VAHEAESELARFRATVGVIVRLCTREDLRALEWHGAFTHHRELIAAAFERQAQGAVLMLVADVGGWPVGQVWIDLTRRAAQGAGRIWALRIVPSLQGAGLGTHLLDAAEELLRRRGFAAAEIGVEPANAGARRLYERLGYRLAGRARETYAYTPPRRPHGEAQREEVQIDEWIMRKPLQAIPLRAAEPRP
jgi:ribosomal protein S18 acetylase RimI-like enzyme